MEGIGDDSGEEDGADDMIEADKVDPTAPKWRHVFTPRTDLPPFTPVAPPGPTSSLGAEKSALDFFYLFLDDDFFLSLLNETDLFAQQEREKAPDKHKMAWTRPSLEEFKAFFGLIFLMGIDVRPDSKMYWSTDYYLQLPAFPKIMTRDRFFQIYRYLHFRDNNDPSIVTNRLDPGYDAIWKIRPIVDHLNTKFRSRYIPKENVSVDESMIPFKGRVHFRQYMKAKPTKWGIKAWAMAESDSGYMLGLNIYCGKSDHTEAGLTYKVVMDLVRLCEIQGQGHTIYMDNLYSSTKLFNDLYKTHLTKAAGTVRLNRKHLPRDIMCKRPLGLEGRGNYVYRYSDPVLALSWQDRKAVCFLSTTHDTTATTCFRITKVDNKWEKLVVPQPQLAADYTAYMGGVDRCDQMMQYYSFGRKTTKWTKRVFFKLLEITKVNAFILFSKSEHHQPPPGKPNLSLLQFTQRLISGLIDGYHNPAKRGRPSVTVPNEVRLTARHLPAKLPNKSWCHVCWRRVASGRQEKRRQTIYGCTECQRHLCLPECFTIYHSVKDY